MYNSSTVVYYTHVPKIIREMSVKVQIMKTVIKRIMSLNCFLYVYLYRYIFNNLFVINVVCPFKVKHTLKTDI